ncbi:L-carnitine dehydratase/bile acid-inducible protein F [Oceanicola granulosus HTCC2516]|uniref:L-carnitine dehydratase/bile acid-inducible protein F n=1 Tax=Oceanicola granulosus (strain ATCC BAA-861 / DSM 15982 / KCTC 12143 / HTCC2516) TaxID=314256 RepID=Q2CH70_OCEGH|nr:CoA transferase [Oceanicola granulosus]EAR51941.1 L-carnitine dehydratase/bile acid-inducible protein F [Oceanicola granulosus HTCC2516]
MPGSEEAARLPLEGLRVLDVSQVMAGPFCCMMLGDMGADVIKVEPPGGGDQTRRAMGFKMKGDDSFGFLNMNRNKRSVVLDLKSEEGREAFLRLAETADIIVENYRPGVVAKLGIDYASVRARNPRIVYASISGFGQTGPWADRPGFDLIAQAASGIMSITGHSDGPPAKSGVPVTDIGCALFTLYAILSAIIGRQASGEGQYIDASLHEAGFAFAIWDISEYWGTGRVPGRIGTANRMAAPYQAVRASDGHFVFGANNDRLFARLCAVIERPDLPEDAMFATNALRMEHRERLIGHLEATFMGRTRAHWVERLLAAGVPAGPISDYGEALDSPQAQARGVVMEVEHPVEGRYKSIGFPVHMSGTPQRVRLPPPLLGEHTDAILAELGLRP